MEYSQASGLTFHSKWWSSESLRQNFQLLRDQFIILSLAQTRDLGALGLFRPDWVPILGKIPESNNS
jgi:hypothetical protein